MTIRTATRNDLPALRELFAHANDSPYDLDAVAEEKCFGDGIAGPPSTRIIEENGRILAAAVASGKWLRVLIVARDARRRGLATQLLDNAQGVTVVAAEPGNYFTPGVPLDDDNARAFFRVRGFLETQTTWNLDVDLGTFTAPAEVLRPTHEDADRVLAYVEREFGRIWRFEAAKAFERETPPAFISMDEGAITGFAVHDVNNRGLGFFGPTGVSKSMRGRGIGGKLLLASLEDLHRLGYSRCVIPWTDALEFYRKVCGARPAQQFVSMVRT
ncbi:MAG: GNAT family N-acetyltransferase [Acidobacteriota bacterium]|nr:GNAT family N-acetyltransferase [Acidobacteriota bacterium]